MKAEARIVRPGRALWIVVALAVLAVGRFARAQEDCARLCNDEPLRVQGNVAVEDFRSEERISPRSLPDVVPFQQVLVFSFPPGVFSQIASFQAPAENGLAIYQIDAEVEQKSRVGPWVVNVAFTSSGQPQVIYVVVPDPGQNLSAPSLSASAQVQLYPDPGTEILVLLSGTPGESSPGTAQAKVGFSGVSFAGP